MNEQETGPESSKLSILIAFVKWFRIYEVLSYSLSRLLPDSSAHCKMTSGASISLKLISAMLLMIQKLSKTTDLLLSLCSIQSPPFFFHSKLFFSPVLSILLLFPWFFYYVSDLSFTNNFPLSCPLKIHVLRFLPLAFFSLNAFLNDCVGGKYLSHLMYNSSFNKYLFSPIYQVLLQVLGTEESVKITSPFSSVFQFL